MTGSARPANVNGVAAPLLQASSVSMNCPKAMSSQSNGLSLSLFVPKTLVPSLPIYHPKAMASSILYLVKKELFRTCFHTRPKHGVKFICVHLYTLRLVFILGVKILAFKSTVPTQLTPRP